MMCDVPWKRSPSPLSNLVRLEYQHVFFSVITTETYRDKAVDPRPNRLQMIVLTMNPGLFLKVLSTIPTAFSMYGANQLPRQGYSEQNRQNMLQKSRSSTVSRPWQIFEYSLKNVYKYTFGYISVCTHIYIHIHIWSFFMFVS